MAKNILVVDDNAQVRKAVCLMIAADCDLSACIEAENGLGAVYKAEHEHPDLIVMDFSMPVMNGLEAAKRIKLTLPNIRIVLVTFHPELFNRDELASFGVSAMISKENAGEEIVPAMRLLLGLTAVTRIVSHAGHEKYLVSDNVIVRRTISFGPEKAVRCGRALFFVGRCYPSNEPMTVSLQTGTSQYTYDGC